MSSPQNPNTISVKVIGQEGDSATVEVNIHQKLHHLLEVGLKALYNPPPSANEYELVFNGIALSDLEKTIEQAGIHNGNRVTIQPKDVSRG
jgi:hypothetical protein